MIGKRCERGSAADSQCGERACTCRRREMLVSLEVFVTTDGLSRADVLQKVREHLSTELEVPLDQISESTRMREDLDADSLDLYELVMELEDTYGISVSEEEAADIETVAQAVDFVAGRLGAAA